MPVPSRWRSAARTEIGKVRTRNEDAFLNCPQLGLWAVADGMGGHRNGDVASQLIVTSLSDLPPCADFEERLDAVRHCLHGLNRRMGQELTLVTGRKTDVMGSTVVALLVEGDRAACIWAGDSRCYLWRSQCLYQLSRDHSLQRQLIDEQHMTKEQAQAHPSANALTRAVGATEHLKLDVVELQLHAGDVFLLCSDGLYQEINSEALGTALGVTDPMDALERLFDSAMSGPARDNLTAVVIRQ